MTQPDDLRSGYIPTPDVVMWRVARDPYLLPDLSRLEGPTHRFDDPNQEYAVRYLASDLYGCLLETMQRFRPDDSVDEKLDRVEGIEPGDIEPDLTQGVEDWIARQQVGQLLLTEEDHLFVNVMVAFDDLDRFVRVRQALRQSFPTEKHLDAATVLSGTPEGRRVTQAISRTIYELPTGPAGIQYLSRRDPQLKVICWAVFSHAPHIAYPETPLNPAYHNHAEALLRVCEQYDIPYRPPPPVQIQTRHMRRPPH